jgi:GxxExxY protein
MVRVVQVLVPSQASANSGMDHITRLPSAVRDPQTYAVIGAALEVHRLLGPGFLESVYREALRAELLLRGVDHACEVELPIRYKDRRLNTKFRADFLCNGAVIVELKALPRWVGQTSGN